MKWFITLLVLSVLVSVTTVAWSVHAQMSQHTDLPANIAAVVPVADSGAVTQVTSADIPTPVPTATPLPDQAQVSVPFTVQAPTALWDTLHENACEEASLVMIKHYLDNTPIPSPAEADTEITNLANWETSQGYGVSITLEQLNQIAKDYYGITTGKIVTVTSIDQVKQELANGNPVILGMAGKELSNPNFKDGGPNYHMLVAIGYDTTGIITNDPGTIHGQNYHYDFQAFFNAIHNWNADNILNGSKEYLVFK